MKIEIITTWYNESFLAPFFLKHYDFVDKINIFLDKDTNDDTLEIITKNPKVVVHPFCFPDMMDDVIRAENINRFFRQVDSDWVINVDADELVFVLPLSTNLVEYLSKEQKYNVLVSQLWQVYRNNSESDLDSSLDIITQRRFGNSTVLTGQQMSYHKPIVCKPRSHNGWEPGNHGIIYNENTKISPQVINGAHWAMADTFAIKRRVQERKPRFSKLNHERNQGFQNFKITEDQVMAELESHKNDSQLF